MAEQHWTRRRLLTAGALVGAGFAAPNYVAHLLGGSKRSPFMDQWEAEAAVADHPGEYWQARAAMLDPAALVIKTGKFDFTPSGVLYPLNAWNAVIGGGSARWDVRRPPGLGSLFALTPGTRVRGASVGSSLAAIDPSLVSYGDPQQRFYDRLSRISSLEQDVLSRSVDGGAPNAAYSGRLDVGRVHFDSGVNPASSGRGLSSKQHEAQQFAFTTGVASGQTLTFSVNLFMRADFGGDMIADVRLDNAGAPGQSIGSATVARSALPAPGSSADSAWVDIPIRLQSQIASGNNYWLVLRGSGGSYAAAWRTARGNAVDYWRAKESQDGGASWNHLSGSVGNFALRVGQATAPRILIRQVVNYDAAWTIISDAFTGAGWNLYQEISDNDPVRYTYEPYFPWDTRYGLHWAMQKVRPVQTDATLIVSRLPSDW